MKVTLVDKITRPTYLAGTCIGCGKPTGCFRRTRDYPLSGNQLFQYFDIKNEHYIWCQECYIEHGHLNGIQIWHYWCRVTAQWNIPIVKEPSNFNNLRRD